MAPVQWFHILWFAIFCAAIQCDAVSDLSEAFLSADGNEDLKISRSLLLEREQGIQFRAVGHSYSILVTMTPPEGMTSKFQASASRNESSRKTCTMALVDNMFVCEIQKLQPYSTYAVALNACTAEDLCHPYGTTLNVRTLPGVPRYVSVANRSQTTFTVFWYKPLEAPDVPHTYKTLAYNKDSKIEYTCEATSSASFLSCNLENLPTDTSFFVSVSACIENGDCSDYTESVLGETLPNPPQNLTVLYTGVNTVRLKVGLAEGDTEGAYAYAAVLEPLNELNTLEYGTQIRKVSSTPNWSTSRLKPATKYRFHGYACNPDNLRCAAAESVTFETKEMSPNGLYITELQNGSVYAYWTSELSSADHTDKTLRILSTYTPMDVYEMPVQPGNFSHIFNGISPASFYSFVYRLCQNNNCSYLDEDNLNTRFEGVKLNQTTNITQTSALVKWKMLRNGDFNIGYVWVYARPVDKSLDQQRCVGTSRQECTLEHLRPDTDYDLVVKACEDIGFCTALKPQGRIRTLKPYTLEPPSDIKSANVWPTSFSLIWSKPVADITDSFEYRVSLTAMEDPTTPRRIFICETSLERDGTVICPVRNLHTDFLYSATVSTCVRADMCSQPSANITVKTGKNDNYILNATAIGPYSATLSWSSTRTKPESEFRVKVDNSPIPSCTSAVTEGPHVCHLHGLLPSTKYTCQLLECQSSTPVCVSMFSFTLSTTTDEKVQKVLRTLAADMTKASAKPFDTTGQLMIRVSYAELGIPDLGNLQGVSAVITPLQDHNMPQSPTWSFASDKKSQFVGGTYVDPIDGSWEVKLPLPPKDASSRRPNRDEVLGADSTPLIDTHDCNGRLTAGTTFGIQLRVYTDLGYGTTAVRKMKTEGKLGDSVNVGAVVALAVFLAMLLGLLVALIFLMVVVVRSNSFQPPVANNIGIMYT